MKFFASMVWMLLVGIVVFACSKDTDKTVDALNAEALNLAQTGQVGQALKLANQAVEKAEAENGPEHPAVANGLETQGLIYQAMGEMDKAEAAHLRALGIVKKTIGPDSEEAAKIMNNLGGLYYTKKQNAEAASFYKQALAVVEKKFPAEDPRLAVLRKNISVCEGGESGGKGDTAAGEAAGKVASPPDAPEQPPAPAIQDLVPQQVKDSMTKQLADQNIFISNLTPRPPVMIEAKGMVFPYNALKKGKDGASAQEVVILFAAAANPEKPNTVIFQQCRLISKTSYLSALEKGGVAQLKKELKEVFPSLYQ